MSASHFVKVRLSFALALLFTAGLSAQTPVHKTTPAPVHKKVAPAKKKVQHHVKHHKKVMKNGNSVERRSNGHISDVHDEQRHMDVHHGLNGDRRVSVMRADHSRIVAERGRGGYIERPYAFHGHDYYRRSYFYHGHLYNRFYRGFYFHGIELHVYAPYRYYPIGFYGWAYHPWHVHVVYAWGWGGSPWYGYYGHYFAPYPEYVSASAWLTDYMISNDLQADYAARQDAGTLDSGPAPELAADTPPALTPEVKDLIAQEVQYDIELENGEAALDAANQEVDPASSGLARMLADGQSHIFVVGSPLDVEDENTQEDCPLSDGDVLQTTDPPGPDDKTASLIVLASKGNKECAKAATVTVDLDDLQEMQNHMRETIDQGMDELQQKQGKDGIPALPPSANAPPTTTAFAKLAPPPDPDAAGVIDQQQKEADTSEKEITAQEAQEDPATPAPPPDAGQQPPAPIVRTTPQ